MNTNKLIRNFLARICEKNYSGAESLLQTVLVEKMKKRVKEKHKTVKGKKDAFSEEEPKTKN
jgi:hypothetical protein